MKKYFSIGETAKINRIPVKTLRFYDEKDLLKPAYINSDTGYRYYSPEQFYLIDIIKYGKRLELSLDEIRSMMQIQDIAHLTKMLKLQKKHAQEKIGSLNKMIASIDSTLNDISYVSGYSDKKAPYRRVKPAVYVAYTFHESHDITNIDIQLKKIISDKGLQPYLTYKYGFFLSVNSLGGGSIEFIGEYVTLNQKPEKPHPSVMRFSESECDCFQYPIFDPAIDLALARDYIAKNDYSEKYIVADEIFYNPEWKDCIYELCFEKQI